MADSNTPKDDSAKHCLDSQQNGDAGHNPAAKLLLSGVNEPNANRAKLAEYQGQHKRFEMIAPAEQPNPTEYDEIKRNRRGQEQPKDKRGSVACM